MDIVPKERNGETFLCLKMKRPVASGICCRSVNEQDSGAGQRGQRVGHLADSGVVDEASEEKHETHNKEHPPQPVLSVKIPREIGGELQRHKTTG